MADGVEVSRRIAALERADGIVPRGLKVGLTNRAVWARLGVNEPFVAPVYEDGVAGPMTIETGQLTAARIEPEVVVGIGAPLPRCASEGDVMGVVRWVALGFEVVDSHYPDWTAAPCDLVADFGCHAGMRVGPIADLSRSDLLTLDDLEVVLRCDDGFSEVGAARVVLGGPLRALAAAMSVPGAYDLDDGDIVSTGTLTGRSHPVRGGQAWTLETSEPGLFAPCEVTVH